MNCKVISIFSNKGGVGKSFISVNLASALALAGQKTLVIDLDVQAGQDMARMLNASPRNSLVDIALSLDKIEEGDSIDKFVAVHAQSSLHFLPAVRAPRQIGLLTPDNVRAFFKKAILFYDFIIIDAGKTFTEALVSILDNSNLVLLVATPDILAVYQIKWCLDIFQSLHLPEKMVKLILNRSESRGGVAWQEIRSVLPCEIFGHVPSDGKVVGLALNKGMPCVIDSPKSRVAEAFFKMAKSLEQGAFFVTPNLKNDRQMSGLAQANAFWEKFGITKKTGDEYSSSILTSGDNNVQELKQKVHEKLVDRLNLDGITAEVLKDSRAVVKVKKTAEEVVTNLVREESGGDIFSHDERQALVRDIVNEALGLGPLEDFLADPDVTDIMVNSKDEIYVEKSGKLILTNRKFISDLKMRSIIDRIIAPLGRRIDESTPMVDARLPDGSRINAIIPPLSLCGPMITIRKFATERIEVQDLIDRYHSLNKPIADFLSTCVLARKNIIISGGTGAGKTTFLNVISEFIPDNERIITIEDAAELKLKKSHWGRLESRPSNIEGRGEVTIRDLFVNCLRMRPDRIVIGECRGSEVLDMLQAMNTGHDGSMTTLHANSTRDVLTRMHSMILLSGIELPVRAINEMIGSAIDVIVHINRFSDGTRKVTGVSEVVGLGKDFQLELEDVFVFEQKGIEPGGKIIGEFIATGFVPKCYKEFATRGLELDRNIFTKTE